MHELQRLVIGLIEGTLSDSQAKMLDELLAGDHEMQVAYHRQLLLHSMLLFDNVASLPNGQVTSAEEFSKTIEAAIHSSARSPEPPPAVNVLACASSADGPFTKSDARDASVAITARPRHPWFRFSWPHGPGFTPTSMLAVITITFFVGAAAAMAAMMSVPKLFARQVESPWNEVPLPPDLVVAQLVRSVDVQWKPETLAIPNAKFITAGQTLDLQSGIAEVVFVKGARVILEGPATLQLESEERATLRSGRLTARVPAQAAGFTVKTPTVRVTDLGTEFGIQVTPDGSSEVFVYEGQVLAWLLNDQGLPAGGNESSLRIREGGEAHFYASRIALKSDRVARNIFVRELPPGPGELNSEAYAEAVLSDRPLAYWRFEDKDEARVVADTANDGSHRDDGMLGDSDDETKAASMRFRGPLGGALKLNGTSNFVEIASSPDLTRAKQAVTIEYWINPEKLFGREHDILSKRNPENIRGFNFESDKHSGVIHHHLAVGGLIEGGPYVAFAYRPGRWQHVAVVWRSGEKLLGYLDGQLVAESARNSSGNIEYDETPLNIGRNSMHLQQFSNYFDGAIDELAIYDQALSAERIASHYNAAYSDRK
jgi:hypothetical protein